MLYDVRRIYELRIKKIFYTQSVRNSYMVLRIKNIRVYILKNIAKIYTIYALPFGRFSQRQPQFIDNLMER